MKNILIIIVTLFLGQNGFSNNNLDNIYNNHEELIENLSCTEEINTISKLSFALGMFNTKIQLETEKREKISKEDKETIADIVDISRRTFKEIIAKNPELKIMDSTERMQIVNSALMRNRNRGITAGEVANCFAGAIAAIYSCGNFNAVSKGVFWTCMVVTAEADIIVVTESGGSLALAIEPWVNAETAFCARVGFGGAVATCVVTAVGDVAYCIWKEFKD
ncbi:hypothetical protein [Aquimarina rubra]|uniref:Uncharacterized protein n=1 Tax=Aquimarina rubra TaxID=1920033 RepID=A0ABW5LBK5_9FLAO